jgi:hypothetical protein
LPKIQYEEHKFRRKSLDLISQANAILSEYEAQGYAVTVRQLYYQFVSRGLIPNSQKSYNRIKSLVGEARLAGLIDWEAIEDRSRYIVSVQHWESPGEIMLAAAQSYRIDKWEGQTHKPEVWIEKEALAGVIGGVCRELDVPYFACKGFTSLSAIWRAGQRLGKTSRNGQIPVILHLGDHDPSGIDMTRDIETRVERFAGRPVEVSRLALNMDQIERYDPPPYWVKETDSRAPEYVKRFGSKNWELDALSPSVIVKLIRDAVLGLRDEEIWDAKVAEEEEHRATLRQEAGQMELRTSQQSASG